MYITLPCPLISNKNIIKTKKKKKKKASREIYKYVYNQAAKSNIHNAKVNA